LRRGCIRERRFEKRARNGRDRKTGRPSRTRAASTRALGPRADEEAGVAAAALLADRGVTIVPGNFDDEGSLESAAQGVDTVFAMSTPYGTSPKTETREGVNMVRAASRARVKHLVYSSVAGADRASGIPHFDSKFEVEKEIHGRTYTTIAPVFFMENLADYGGRDRKRVDLERYATRAADRGGRHRAVRRARHRPPKLSRQTNRHSRTADESDCGCGKSGEASGRHQVHRASDQRCVRRTKISAHVQGSSALDTPDVVGLERFIPNRVVTISDWVASTGGRGY
jgi:hypothetical protein